MEYNYQKLRYFENLLVEYLNVLHSSGLTIEDYYQITYIIRDVYEELNSTYKAFTSKYGSRSDKRIIKERKFTSGLRWDDKFKMNEWTENEVTQYRHDRELMKDYTKYLNGLLYDYRKLEALLKEKLVGETPTEFIRRNTSLTHLVYANNTHPVIKPHSKNSFLFQCQLHCEKTPSFSVDNLHRSGHCYGCGKVVDPVTFIEYREYLSEEESIGLIATVYNIDMPYYALERHDDLIQKYKSALLSPEYKELLEKGYARTKKYRQTSKVRLALDTYSFDLQTIERVKKGEHILYIPPEELPKKLTLDFPFSHE